jgi:serine/threonine protein kinase
MPTDRKKRNVLLKLAAEGVVPVIGGCAGALIAGPVGGLAGIVVAQSVEKAINLFGKGIVEKWREWFATATPDDRAAAVAELAALPPDAAREEALAELAELAPDADPRDLAVALDYLSSLPKSLGRALVPDQTGRMSLPATITWDDAHSLLQLLPQDVAPYAAAAQVPGTPYRLEELLGTGGFGAVYRASSPTLQHLPLAIKFCLDRSLLPALNLERSNLERLMRAAGERGAGHVVKLYGYDLDHPTPYLVYEYVPGGDLTGHLARHRAETGRAMTPAEVLSVITQLGEGLAFAHRAGLVHRDVKPANVLVDAGVLKLADFGLGGVAVRRAVERSRIGATTIDFLSLAERASLFRGAGTPLYMSPEQRRGANPDPKHDLYSLGVLWFQLLAGDVTRELHPGWAKELTIRFGVPAGHIALIDQCVGWFDERPKDAGELLPLLRQAAADALPVATALPVSFPFAQPASRPAGETKAAAVTPLPDSVNTIRKERLLELLRRFQSAMADPPWMSWRAMLVTASVFFVVVASITIGVTATDNSTHYTSGRSTGKIGYTTGEIIAAALGVGAPVSAGLTAILAFAVRTDAGWRARGDRKRSLAALRAEFPAEVEAWGGPERLRSRAVVAAVLDQVARPDFRVSPVTAAQPARPAPDPRTVVTPELLQADPMRMTVFRSRLLEFLNARSFASVINVVLGITALPVAFSLVTFAGYALLVDHYGSRDWLAALLAGVLVGLGTSALLGVIWQFVMRALRSRLRERADELARTYGPVFDQWGGPGFLHDKEALTGVIAELYGAEGAGGAGSRTRSQ